MTIIIGSLKHKYKLKALALKHSAEFYPVMDNDIIHARTKCYMAIIACDKVVCCKEDAGEDTAFEILLARKLNKPVVFE